MRKPQVLTSCKYIPFQLLLYPEEQEEKTLPSLGGAGKEKKKANPSVRTAESSVPTESGLPARSDLRPRPSWGSGGYRT